MDKHDLEPGYVYRPWITLPNGKRIYAWQYGLKAFRLRVKHSLPPLR